MSAPAGAPLAEVLATRTREAILYERQEGGKVVCYACGHRCPIPEGRPGVCKVRFNRGGVLYAPFGYVGALQCDPIEKKPFFHAFPGSDALSFGMLGCDFHCGYCQNWITSQAIRDPGALAPPRDATPESLVSLARQLGARVVASTYNEPLITSEWAVEVFRHARRAGLACAYISNGNGTPEVLRYIRPFVDLYKVDLKSFQDREYRKLGGRLETVLDTVRRLKGMGFWVEIVTLVVPGLNDSAEELRDIARFLVSVSPEIPWHVTAFHPDYKMTDRDGTAASKLLEAVEIGRSEGLHFVYAGNLPGRVGDAENTTCPKCRALLIARRGYVVRENRLRDGACPDCGAAIPGFWRPEPFVEPAPNGAGAAVPRR
ncbi:MAG TPA: AmmeMemoRadiSam system radical SAM enzyme [Planctomycetota bacterium]|nr:AmmeMemoRadiSam system radical SAM enzyme [Planctomycetota bacterium]